MIIVQTAEQFRAAFKVLHKASVIAIDTETKGKLRNPLQHPAQGNRLIGISTHCILSNSDYAVNFYFPFRHQWEDAQVNLFTQSENLPLELLPEFAPVLNRSDVLLLFWHFKFDAQMFRADGLWWAPNIDNIRDGMVRAQLIDENVSHRLKDQGAMAFGKSVRNEEKELHELVRKARGFHKVTPIQMAPYACRDAQLTYDLDPILEQQLGQSSKFPALAKRDMHFQEVLLELEWDGINFDQDLAVRLARKSRNRMRQIENELGFDPLSKLKLSHNLFGSSASGGLGLPYQDLTLNKSTEFPYGIPKMDEQVLLMLRHPTAELVREYRHWQKAESTYYQGWINRAGHDGRIHPTYNVTEGKEKFGTVTSRLSSWIQQIPRDPRWMVKLQLMPDDPDSLLVEADYRQIEYRWAAVYADDEKLIEQFRAGVDTHQVLADQLDIDRDSAKQTAYTILYGGQGYALAINLMKQVWLNERRIMYMSKEEGQAIVDAYFRVHPKMKIASKTAELNARKYGWVQLWNGRRRHFRPDEPHTWRKAFNSVLQGGAAQTLVESMLMLQTVRDRNTFRMRAQIHDSLIFNIDKRTLEEDQEVIREIMEWPSKKLAVPFPIDFKVIRGWGLDAATSQEADELVLT